jgi:hypothetical protein
MGTTSWGLTMDNYGLTLVDLKKVGYRDNPCVLAECVAQMFYVLDPANEKMHVVISGKKKMLQLRMWETEISTTL